MNKVEITNPLSINHVLRGEAVKRDVSFVDLLLQKIKSIESETGIPRTVFAACPNSTSVIKASLRAAKRNNAPVKFAATLNQVDGDGASEKNLAIPGLLMKWVLKKCMAAWRISLYSHASLIC